METFIIAVLAGVMLFAIILYAVKMAVKEAYFEIKEDLLKELKGGNQTDSKEN